MTRFIKIVLFIIYIFILSTKQVLAMPAFPGAQGFGSETVGGRGGKIIEVTNLNDSGTGSFRDAVQIQSGPRIVIFKIGGLIKLLTPVSINNPFITIAGQTATGDGIAISQASLSIETHDVIVRGLKFRIGDSSAGEAPTERDGIRTGNYKNQVYNVVVDHNSIAWAVDENLSTWYPQHDITFSWNISTEGLNNSIHTSAHSMGMLIGENSKNISFHHNLLASNMDRNPYLQGGSNAEIINNVVYNWDTTPTNLTSYNESAPLAINVDVIGNYYIETGNSNELLTAKSGIRIECGTFGKIYVKGNVGWGRRTDTGDEWSAVTLFCPTDKNVLNSTIPVSESGSVAATSPTIAYDDVLNYVGSVPRDSVDLRAINSVRNKVSTPLFSGKWLVDSPSDVGGMPVYQAGTASVDSDKDGMPDTFEQSRGGDLLSASVAPSGYTWVEEYINSLIPSQTGQVTYNVADQEPDGDVDYLDFNTLITNFGLNGLAGWIRSDIIKDGVINIFDFNKLITNFGK